MKFIPVPAFVVGFVLVRWIYVEICYWRGRIG